MLALLAALNVYAGQQPIVLDQAAHSPITLKKPAKKLITLAPHLTELVFDSGAGERLIATVEFSDYPAAAALVPRIGNAFQVDLERVVAMQPDLVIGWHTGNPEGLLAQLEKLGLTVWRTQINQLSDIAGLVEDIGRATGQSASARRAANRIRAAAGVLADEHLKSSPVSYFYQVSERPLYTINGRHLISTALALCGGKNVFAGLDSLAPSVSREAVIAAQPQVIFAPASDSLGGGLAHWLHWPQMEAVSRGNLFYLEADQISRATGRMLDALAQACHYLGRARQQDSKFSEVLND